MSRNQTALDYFASIQNSPHSSERLRMYAEEAHREYLAATDHRTIDLLARLGTVGFEAAPLFNAGADTDLIASIHTELGKDYQLSPQQIALAFRDAIDYL